MLLTFPLMTRADAASSGAVEIRVEPIGLRLQAEFTRLWEDVKVSLGSVTREFEGYHTHYKSELQRMNMDESVSVQDDPAEFLRNVTGEIFQHISLKRYPFENPRLKVKRRNHGWLNHVRSMFFTYVVLGIFHHRSSIRFQRHYPTVAHRTLALLASLCTSLLRIQEGGENSTMLTQPQFKAVFPELSKMNGFADAKRLNRSWQVKPYALFSALFFLALCKTHRSVRDDVVPPLFVEQLAFGICFFSTSRSAGSNQLQQDLLLDYRMTSVGHYLDHCRASHSNLDEQAHLTQLWRTIGAQPEDRELVRRVVFTAMTSTEHAGVKPLSSRTDLRALCKSLKGRYQHPLFAALSNDFDTSIRRMQDVLTNARIVWSVVLGSTTTWFDQNATEKLEKAFLTQSSITLNQRRFTYTLDTKNMTQTNQATKTTRPIRRHELLFPPDDDLQTLFLGVRSS